MWASPLASAISIQQPIAWHTDVTRPSVVTVAFAYFVASFAMLASAIFGLPRSGAPSFTAGGVLAPAGVFDSHPSGAHARRTIGIHERTRVMPPSFAPKSVVCHTPMVGTLQGGALELGCS